MLLHSLVGVAWGCVEGRKVRGDGEEEEGRWDTGYVRCGQNPVCIRRCPASPADPSALPFSTAAPSPQHQYTRGRIPGYTGYKPKAARNITLEQPAHGPTTATTMGAANAQAWRNGVPEIDNT